MTARSVEGRMGERAVLSPLSALSVGGLFLPCLQGQVLWGRPGLAALCDRVRCLEPALVSAPGV